MTARKAFKKLLKRIMGLRPVTWLISLILYAYALLICHTTKWTVLESKNFDAIMKKHKNIIAVSWHSRGLLMPCFWKRKYPLNALVSRHQDGRIIANLMKLSGIKTIDGSTSTDAASSALKLVRVLQNGESVCITPDGPRGPRQRLSMSPVYLAQKTGTCILPLIYSSRNAKIIWKSWDRMLLPKPFAEGVVLVGEPISVPSSLNKDEMERCRREVEDVLNRLQYRADELTGLPQISPAAPDENRKDRKKGE